MKTKKIVRHVLLGVTLLGIIPLAQARNRDSGKEIKTIVNDKTGNFDTPPLSEQDLQNVLKKPLNLNQVVWIAFNLNPDMKAKLAEGQISLAEMKRMGLIESPQLGFTHRFPVSSPGTMAEHDIKLTQNLIDLIQLSSRKKIGRSDYESKKWEIANNILAQLAEVKKTYYDYQATLQLKSFWQSNFTAAKAQSNLASEQRKAGNISALDEAQHMAFFKIAQLELTKSHGQVLQSRIELAKTMGISSFESAIKIPNQLPKIPGQDPKLSHLKELAFVNRPDLVAQKYKIESYKKSVQLAKSAWIPNFNMGVSAKWDAGGSKGVGPVVQMGLPFLGHRKTSVQKAKTALEWSEKSLQALEQNLPSEVEALYQQLQLARQTVQLYQAQVFPIQEQIVSESLKHYNYMLLGNYELLQSKQNQISAKRDFIAALHDYWTTRADLEFLVGGSFEAQLKLTKSFEER